jgi:ribosomal protein S8E
MKEEGLYPLPFPSTDNLRRRKTMNYGAVIDSTFSEMKFVHADEDSKQIDDIVLQVKNNPEFNEYLSAVIVTAAMMMPIDSVPTATLMHGIAFGMYLQKKIDDLKELEQL